MPTPRELLNQAKEESSPRSTRGRRLRGASTTAAVPRRPRARGVRSRERIPGGRPPAPRPAGVLGRGAAARQVGAGRVVYCASGVRSVFAARTLARAGLCRRGLDDRGLSTGWKDDGQGPGRRRGRSPPTSATATSATCSCPTWAGGGPAAAARLQGPLLGAGGLGSPAALYLAAAGVGTLGIIDMGRRRRVEPPAPDLHNMT